MNFIPLTGYSPCYDSRTLQMTGSWLMVGARARRVGKRKECIGLSLSLQVGAGKSAESIDATPLFPAGKEFAFLFTSRILHANTNSPSHSTSNLFQYSNILFHSKFTESNPKSKCLKQMHTFLKECEFKIKCKNKTKLSSIKTIILTIYLNNQVIFYLYDLPRIGKLKAAYPCTESGSWEKVSEITAGCMTTSQRNTLLKYLQFLSVFPALHVWIFGKNQIFLYFCMRKMFCQDFRCSELTHKSQRIFIIFFFPHLVQFFKTSAQVGN